MAKGKSAIEGAKSLFDLLFLHNTDADKLARIDRMGGMPMPSIAATQKDIPFEGYGDITLIGRKDSLAPSKVNKFWDADAYTVRAPSPFRMANKKAWKQFDDDYADFKQYGYVDNVRYLLDELGAKSTASDSSYGDAVRFFESDGAAIAKFVSDMGQELPTNMKGKVDTYALRDFRDANRFAYDRWMQGELDRYFQPEEYFLAKRSVPTDTGRTRAVIKPYTADEITKHMKKSAGAAQESAMTIGGTGANRAATANRLNSLDEMRAKRDMLQPREESAVIKETLSMMQDDIMEDLKPYYRYSADGWQYLDEAGGMLVNSDKMGLTKAMDEYGFDNVPDELVQRINSWKDELRSAPTEYFEGKPERVVGLGEFAGAIVPQNTPQNVLDMLGRYGMDVQKYGDDAERTALRNKYSSEMFTNPVSVLGALSGQSVPSVQQQNAQLELDKLMGQYNEFMDRKPDIYSYGELAPLKRNVVSGEYSLAVPTILDEIVKGLADVGQSRKTGVVNSSTSLLDALL